jgi:hypothetical protein
MTTKATKSTIHEPAAEPVARPSARTMIRRLVMSGCTPTEAANLAGLAVGLRPVAAGWTSREIERLRFLLHLAASGRLPA